jgi:glutamine synthetase
MRELSPPETKWKQRDLVSGNRRPDARSPLATSDPTAANCANRLPDGASTTSLAMRPSASLEEKASVKQVSGSLEEVLDTLEGDHQWLLEGGVFTQDVIDNVDRVQASPEVDAIRLRLHLHEFHMYYDMYYDA